MKSIPQPTMKTSALRAIMLGSMLVITACQALAADAGNARSKTSIEAATRLQVFLDRAEFAPGKIDGHYGEFTVKALTLYRQAHGEKNQIPPEKSDRKQGDAPDVSGLNLDTIDPLFITYTVTESDLQSIGELPDSVPEQAKKKSLPYKSATEAVAEKFHMDMDFLMELNPGKTKEIKAGAKLSVPNVEPFELGAVKNLKAGKEISMRAANDIEEGADTKKKDEDKSSEPIATTTVKIDVATNMPAVYEGEKIIAAYPVTIGSAQTESPIGDWKVQSVAKMPNFRYDKAMLKKGERSDDFHMLPSGPNNPVGVIWIALNKKGIGLHGTNEPDNIGRSASHGCVRMANWDVARLAGKVKSGVPVSIR